MDFLYQKRFHDMQGFVPTVNLSIQQIFVSFDLIFVGPDLTILVRDDSLLCFNEFLLFHRSLLI